MPYASIGLPIGDARETWVVLCRRVGVLEVLYVLGMCASARAGGGRRKPSLRTGWRRQSCRRCSRGGGRPFFR